MIHLLMAALAAAPLALAQDGKAGFANPELLVTTEWLAQHSADADVRVVDVRSAKDYAVGHVPGAVHVSVGETFDPEAPSGTVGRPEAVAALFGSRGIGHDTHVVLYDGGRSTSAARVFWTLEYCGHSNVSVVDGGLTKWRAQERDVTDEPTVLDAVDFEVEPRPGRLSEQQRMLDTLEQAAFIDARSDREWNSGRIPGAVHIDWARNFSDDDPPVFKSPEQLGELYADIARDVDVHTY